MTPRSPAVRVLGLVLLLGGPFALSAGAGSDPHSGMPLRVTRITPEGDDVPAGRQIVIQFNRPVVPIGRMRRELAEIPVSITPFVACQWQWLDTSSLACQLDEDKAMAQATAYHLTLRPGIRAEDGATLPSPVEHRFITERPQVRHAWFNTWRGPGAPVIRLIFNQSVTRDSIEKHLYFRYAEGKRRYRKPLRAEPDPDDAETPRYVSVPGEKGLIFDFGRASRVRSDDDPRSVGGVEARRVWRVSPAEALRLDAEVGLEVEPGLVSALGPETGAERRVLVDFRTFPEFAFLGVRCTTLDNRRVLIAQPSDAAAGKCDPLAGTELVFSSPVLPEEVKRHVQIAPDLAGGREDYDPWANVGGYSRLAEPHTKGADYGVLLPEILKADHAYRVTIAPAGGGGLETLKGLVSGGQLTALRDEFGRRLPAPVDLGFLTDHRRPDYRLAHRTGVLEGRVDSEVPLYVTNLDQVHLDYRRLTPDGAVAERRHTLEIADAKDVSFAIPLKVRGMLEGGSGAVYAKLSSSPRVGKSDYERTLFAIVTPFALHAKIGHFNSLTWVTDLESGAPVAGARVSLYRDAVNTLAAAPQVLAEGRTDAAGLVELPGTATLDPALKTFGWDCGGDACTRLFVRVDSGRDMALMPLDHRFQVDTYGASGDGVYPTLRREFGHLHTWGTTAQGVYRAGDTIQYKIYVRNQGNAGYVPAPESGYTLVLVDPAGTKVFERKDIRLNAFGALDGEITVPESGVVGWYRFQLSAAFTPYEWTPMRVLVSDFTPAPFRVTAELNGDAFRPGQPVEIASAAHLHSGGGYRDAEVRVTARLKEKPFSSKHPLAQGFRFDTWRGRPDKTVFQKTDFVDAKGEHVSRFTLPEADVVFGTLAVESAVRDDRGKYIAASRTAEFLGADRFVGLKSDAWLYHEDEPAALSYLVVDDSGAPAAGTAVKVRIERLESKVARVKGAGNAYLTHYTEEWKPVDGCEGVSTGEALPCRFTPQEAGTYRLTAAIEDTHGRAQSTEMQVWVAGKGRVLWNMPDDNSLQIVPEKTDYAIGETARYLIRNPFPSAQALVTVERYGVLRRWVKRLEGSTPVVEFPVEPDMMPGFYLSVTVLSPRVEAPPPAATVDLGKPAFRMGYVAARVTDPYKALRVKVETERDTYKPRETVHARIRAEAVAGDSKEPIELAVAVLDEAVFDLIAKGKAYYDPYAGFYRLDGLDLRNYNLLMRLVGRQKFEKKGANPGGDGGASLALRSLFKFVSYWNPSLRTDARGRAEFDFELPDNLTGWRILALAVTPAERMGLGDASIKVNRPTELRPAMPNQVTEGDSFKAGFSVMNRTDTARTLAVRIEAKGDIAAEKGGSAHTEKVALGPYQRKTLWMPVSAAAVKAGRDVRSGAVTFTARAEDALDGDALTHRLPVNKRRALEIGASYGSTASSGVRENVLFPKEIHTDVGDVSVVLSPSVIGNVAGAFRYLRDYPYTCWEQILTKGVMAAHFLGLKDHMPDDFAWPESRGLPEDILKKASSFQAPNGGMVYFLPLDAYVSPYLSAYTALAFTWLRDAGYAIPAAVEGKLHGYLLSLLRQDVLPDFYTKGMASTVRAVALAALARSGKITRDDLDRYRPHAPLMSLFGKAHFLQAARAVAAADISQETRTAILAASSRSGGKVLFNEELDDGYTRILATPLRDNCAVLSALVGAAGKGADAEGVLSRLVRAITQARGNRDHWENTQENLFCMNALIDYARVYEAVRPDMRVTVSLDRKPFGRARFDDFRDPAVTVTRPIEKGDPGREAAVAIDRNGAGRLYYATRLSYAPLAEHAEAIDAGIDIRREYSVERGGKWVLIPDDGEIRRGELVRVDLYVSLPTARNFVVVDDPVPGGLEPVNRDLATASGVDADAGAYQPAGGAWWFQYGDWQGFNASRWSFYHQELRHDAVRFYSDYLPAGRYHLAYTAQAIATGSFARMPVRAEEMYDPDIYGKGVPSTLRIRDDP